MRTTTLRQEKISIPMQEYVRLKKLDKRLEIREARKEIERKKIIPQEKLFEKLGL